MSDLILKARATPQQIKTYNRRLENISESFTWDLAVGLKASGRSTRLCEGTEYGSFGWGCHGQRESSWRYEVTATLSCRNCPLSTIIADHRGVFHPFWPGFTSDWTPDRRSSNARQKKRTISVRVLIFRFDWLCYALAYFLLYVPRKRVNIFLDRRVKRIDQQVY